MRKFILVLTAIVIAMIFFIIIFGGIQFGNFRIYSYKEIVALSKEKTSLLSALDEKNIGEYNKTLKSLQTSVQTYEKTKTEYDRLVAEGKITEKSVYNSIDLFNSDELGNKIEGYAKEKNVILVMEVVPSTTSTSVVASEYVMCDLNFKVSGDYIAITDFIYKIEDDDTLNFEIKDFSLKEEEGILNASFSVKNIPINSQSLTK